MVASSANFGEEELNELPDFLEHVNTPDYKKSGVSNNQVVVGELTQIPLAVKSCNNYHLMVVLLCDVW